MKTVPFLNAKGEVVGTAIISCDGIEADVTIRADDLTMRGLMNDRVTELSVGYMLEPGFDDRGKMGEVSSSLDSKDPVFEKIPEWAEAQLLEDTRIDYQQFILGSYEVAGNGLHTLIAKNGDTAQCNPDSCEWCNEGERVNNEALEQSIVRGKNLGKLALYFGCWGKSKGHYLVDSQGQSAKWGEPDFPWDIGLIDTGLLKNGKVKDTPTGEVYWTCGGATAFWYAFYWWDRSVDSRPNSNSGFYVRGFGWPEPQAAFDYACAQFPSIVARQKFPLVLQYVRVKEEVPNESD